MKILFIAGFGPIMADAAASRRLYVADLGLAYKEEAGGYLHSESLEGCKSFGLWPLRHAAESCFGRESWPRELVIPQAWVEFEVEDVEQATVELEQRGYTMLVRNRREPWGQTLSRFLAPEGLLVGVTFTPWMRGGV